MTDKHHDATRDGAALAFAEWLADRDVTTADAVEAAVRTAVRDWLDANSEQITAAIADVARGSA